MVRTQIQLTEDQTRFLKAMAREHDVSVAEIIRRSINQYIRSSSEPTMAEKRQRALSVIGIASSGLPDLGSEHDRYLDEAYGDFGQ